MDAQETSYLLEGDVEVTGALVRLGRAKYALDDVKSARLGRTGDGRIAGWIVLALGALGLLGTVVLLAVGGARDEVLSGVATTLLCLAVGASTVRKKPGYRLFLETRSKGQVHAFTTQDAEQAARVHEAVCSAVAAKIATRG